MNFIKPLFVILFFVLFIGSLKSRACSVVYYIDKITGHIYIANHEDYWYDTKAYIQVVPKSDSEYARLWYGWDNFAQGGINEAGLFFDGAVTPEQQLIEGFQKPKGNLGDRILANCANVEEALALLDKEKVALANAHMMLGDSAGNAVVVEWIEGERKLIWISENRLVMTNFLLADTAKGNYPCYRYSAIEQKLDKLEESGEEVSLLKVGNVLGSAAQTPKADNNGKIGGTLYSSFIDISKMEFVLAFKLDNAQVTKIDLKQTFREGKKRKIKL